MKKPAPKAFILAVGVVFVVMLTAGCEEQNLSGTKRSRLIAAENRQLKEQLKQRDAGIERQKELLEKCLEEKKSLEEQMKEKIKSQVSDILALFGEADKEVREENEKLEAQIEELQKEIDNLKAEITRLKEELKELRKKPSLPDQPQPL